MKRELILVIVVVFALQACLPRNVILTESPATDPPGDIPTWTPRSGETLATPPNATMPSTPTSTATPQTLFTNTPLPISVKIEGGNLNIRRGPSVYYDMISFLKDGNKISANARDRKGDWVYVEIPGSPGKFGWISLLTDYTIVSGHVDDLPYKEADPAVGAYIRNCTNHKMWVMPAYIELATESASPYNEDQFWPGIFYVYDLSVDDNKPFMEISVKEGSQIDIIKDGNGTKSKCE
jgi:hypothetical protein